MTSAMVILGFSEFAAAYSVQQRFMQQVAPEIDALGYSARCRQLGELGGDCYDFVPLSGGRLALAIGDASGKGLAAALMISSVQSSLRMAAQFTGDDVPATMQTVNRHVHASSLEARYATFFYGIFDPAARTLEYVNAGHNPPMVLRRDGTVAWLETGGVPLGLFADVSYTRGTIQLDAGDLVIAYTDGVVEATGHAGDEWGVRGLQYTAVASSTKPPAEIVDAIFTAMDRFSCGHQADDATVVVLRVE